MVVGVDGFGDFEFIAAIVDEFVPSGFPAEHEECGFDSERERRFGADEKFTEFERGFERFHFAEETVIKHKRLNHV